MTLLEAMHDEALFGAAFRGASWRAWEAVLKAAFAVPMDEAARSLALRLTGRTRLPAAPVRELWAVVGRRGGKSRIAAFLAAYFGACVDWTPYLAPGEVATIPVIAADKKQARTCKRYIEALLTGTPMLEAVVSRVTDDALELHGGRVVIEIFAGSFKTIRGYSVPCAVLDECAFWRDETSVNPDVETLAALRPAMASFPRPLLVGISSPYRRQGILWTAYRTAFARDDVADVLVVQADTRTLNPTLSPAVVEAAYRDDPERAAAEYGAQFRTDLERFLSAEVVEQAIEPRTDRGPVSGVPYLAVADPSGGSFDRYTLAVGHVEGETIVIDAVRYQTPPFSPEVVTADFAAVVTSYGVTRVRGDRYAGEWPREQWRKHGVVYEPLEAAKSDLYLAALPRFMAGQVRLPDDRVLRGELLGLERRTGRTGKDTVDHGPGARDDVANAVCALVALARPGLEIDFTTGAAMGPQRRTATHEWLDATALDRAESGLSPAWGWWKSSTTPPWGAGG